MSYLGFSDKYKFGVELEFSNDEKSLNELYCAFLLDCLPVKYLRSHKKCNIKYDRWYLDIDPTVSFYDQEEYFGGEVSSKILSDNSNDWYQLKEICNILKENGSYISDQCSEHITVDVNRFLTNPKFFEVLYKILILYENEIILFYMGDKFLKRKTRVDFADNMSFRLLENIDYIDFNSIKSIIVESDAFKLRDGISFYKLDKGLIEVRYPNGTLEFDTVLNNINFTLSLIDAISNDKFDMEYLNYMIKSLKRDINYIFNYLNINGNLDNFNYLIDIISRDSESKNNFSSQYQKVLKTRKK